MSELSINPKSPILFPVNVRVIQKTTSGNVVNDLTIKNRVLKEYGLYSWVRFIMGDFHNNSLIDEGQYIPKYLAVGNNGYTEDGYYNSPLTGAEGTDTSVKVTDVSLYHELNDSAVTGEAANKNRIKLNRASYIEDNKDQPYLKIQYEAYIPENRFVNEYIGEFALMTKETGWNAFARITGFEPFKKIPNTVVQVIWEITIISAEANSRLVPPIKKYLQEAVEKAIDVLRAYKNDPEDLPGARAALEYLIQPGSINGTGLWYLLNDNEQITQEAINEFLSRPLNSINDTGLIPLINEFDPNWKPSGKIV